MILLKESVTSYLNSNSVKKYYIEFQHFRSNHLADAAVALCHLNDTEEHFQKYVQHYCKRLEPSDGPTATDHKPKDEEALKAAGGRHGYYTLLDHYTTLLNSQYNGSPKKLVSQEFPKLSMGLAGAALHPLIHIGYGLSIDSPELVVEGMSYLHFSNQEPNVTKVPDIKTFGQGSKDFLEVLEDIRTNNELYKYLEEDSMKRLQTYPDDDDYWYLARMKTILDKGDILMEYAHLVKLPARVGSGNESHVRWLIDQAITAYARSEDPNEFCLLHGVTASWGLLQVSKYITEDQLLYALRSFICAILAIYLVKGRPKIMPGPSEELRDQLESVTLTALRNRILSLPVEEVDVHDFKLLHVCQDQDAHNLNKEMKKIYVEAVLVNQSFPFSFNKGP